MKGSRIISPTKRKILLLLAAGIALNLTRSPKRYYSIAKATAEAWKDIDRQYLYRALNEFRHERLISYREQNDGAIAIVLTEQGKQITLRFDIDNLEIKKPARWDRKWRIVLYDIPDKKKGAREELRHKLRALGFHEWQESVFIHPFPCENEINFLVEFLEIRPYVRYAEIVKTTNEAELKIRFNLI